MGGRREFLKFLLGSPLLVGAPYLAEVLAQSSESQGAAKLPASAADALDVFDFEAAAKRLVPPAHWGYLATGVDGDETLLANRQGFSRYQLHTRRFVDVSRIDLKTEIFGTVFSSPIVLCPV